MCIVSLYNCSKIMAGGYSVITFAHCYDIIKISIVFVLALYITHLRYLRLYSVYSELIDWEVADE